MKTILPGNARVRHPLVDGQKMAVAAGNAGAANMVLPEVVSKRPGIADEYRIKALEKMVPARALEVNKRAFQMGR